MPLRLQREVDHHDRVLLDDAHQQDDADQADHRQILPEQHQRQNGADARRRQRRENGDRVNVALIEHAEHDVDGDERRQDQPRLAGQRFGEFGGIAGEQADDAAGMPIRVSIVLTASTASPSAAPGARLKLSETAGNCA